MDARRGQFLARVVANVPLCREHYRLVLGLEWFPPSGPGQFVQLACRDPHLQYSIEREADWAPGRLFDVEGRELMTPLPLLRRPFSIAGRRDAVGGVELDIIHRAVGVATRWLAGLEAGQSVDLLGPLGNCFSLPRPGQEAILVGGGVGVPPMLYLAEKLAGRPAVAFCGVTCVDLLPLTLTEAGRRAEDDPLVPALRAEEFARHGVPSVITTDDGSYGFGGYVTQALERYLEGSGFSVQGSTQRQALNPVIYTCGPELMMRRVAEIALARGIQCQVAVERAMACGMGTCQSCVIRVKAPATGATDGRDWVYRLACTDGTIFRAGDLMW